MTTSIETQIQTSLLQNLITSLTPLVPGVTPVSLSNFLSPIVNTQVKNIVSAVDSQSSELINSIEDELVGDFNPIDFVSGNFGSTGLRENLLPTILDSSSPDLVNGIVNSIAENIRTIIPAGLNIPTNLTTLLRPLIQPVVNSSIEIVFTSYIDKIYADGPDIEPIMGGTLDKVSSLFSSLSNTAVRDEDFDDVLDVIDLDYADSLISGVLSEARNFKVSNPDNVEKETIINKGFTDPSATYPKKEYDGEPETNKLARGVVTGTIVQKKNDERLIGAKLPYGNSFDEPVSPYKGEYPYNKITETEQGHIIEVDDTPGCERLHVYHKSGTYIEIDANGSIVKKTRGSSYEIIDRNGKIAIRGQADVSINGACNIYVGNDANMEVLGNVNLTCHNNITAMAGKRMNLSAKDEINIHSGNVNIESDYTTNIFSDGEFRLLSKKDAHLKSNASIYTQSANTYYLYSNASANVFIERDFNLNTKKSILVKCVDDISFKSKNFYSNTIGGSVNFSTNNQFNVHSLITNLYSSNYTRITSGQSFVSIVSSSGHVALNGSTVYLNTSGFASPASSTFLTGRDAGNSIIASNANMSNIGLLNRFVDVSSSNVSSHGFNFDLVPKTDVTEVEDPENITSDLSIIEELEGFNPSDSQVTKHHSKLVLRGITTTKALTAKPLELEKTTAASIQDIIISPNDTLRRKPTLPGNFNLSNNFTIDDLWLYTAVSPGKYPITSQLDLTYGDIIYNLQAIALNVLEPVLALYPNMVIVSGFRSSTVDPNSPHSKGLAVDLQFKGVSRSEHYHIAVKLAKVLAYDQLMLEYFSHSTLPWLHISVSSNKVFTPGSLKKESMTFNNNKLYSNGLANLI